MTENFIESVNRNTSQSQFKYHFILRKISFPISKFDLFIERLHKCFPAQLASTSIAFVQIEESIEDYHDLVIGFRTDTDALAVISGGCKFYFEDKVMELQIASGFKWYLQSQGLLEQEVINSQYEIKQRQKEIDILESKSDSEPYVEVSHFEKYYLPLLPTELNKNNLLQKLTQLFRFTKDEVILEEDYEDIPNIILKTTSKSFIKKIKHDGLRLPSIGYLLVIKDEQLRDTNLKHQIRRHQTRALRVSSFQEDPFEELIKGLKNLKTQKLKIVSIIEADYGFVITSHFKISKILKFMNIPNWKFEALGQPYRVRPTLNNRWYSQVK